jgi:hypothetical protein
MVYYPVHRATMPGEDLGGRAAVCDSDTLSGTSVEEERRRQHAPRAPRVRHYPRSMAT